MNDAHFDFGQPLYTTRTLARKLATSPRVIRDRNDLGQLPTPLKIGTRLYWKFEDIQGWLDALQRAEHEFRTAKRNGGRR